VLEDGNHRVESIRQAGRRRTWAVVGFERPQERDRFADAWRAIETRGSGGNPD